MRAPLCSTKVARSIGDFSAKYVAAPKGKDGESDDGVFSTATRPPYSLLKIRRFFRHSRGTTQAPLHIFHWRFSTQNYAKRRLHDAAARG
jgi:hypothetical protein